MQVVIVAQTATKHIVIDIAAVCIDGSGLSVVMCRVKSNTLAMLDFAKEENVPHLLHIQAIIELYIY